MFKRTYLKAILLAICSASWAANAQFVKTENRSFTLDQKPYHFVGTNYWYGSYLGLKNKSDGKTRLSTELDQLEKIGVDNLRILAGSELSNFSKSVSPTTQPSPGKINEDLLVGLDHLLSEMNKRDMKAVLYLTNFWQWSGGMTQYNAWAEKTVTQDPDVSKDWERYIADSASFYSSSKANSLYRSYIENLVNRENTITGVAYKDDPTIMAWELANEPRAGTAELSSTDKSRFISWVSSTADFIKSIDKNHLVTTGNEGIAGTSQDHNVFVNAHNSKNIDYLTVHLWPKNWGWLDMSRPEETFPVALKNTKDYLDIHLSFAETLNKPMVLEEFGVERDLGNYSADNSTKYRDRFYQTVFSYIEDSAKQGTGYVGSNFWGWAGSGRAMNDDYGWKVGDAFTADPPQEPQGLNSVFDSDKTTLEVIKNHGINLRKLNTVPSDN